MGQTHDGTSRSQQVSESACQQEGEGDKGNEGVQQISRNQEAFLETHIQPPEKWYLYKCSANHPNEHKLLSVRIGQMIRMTALPHDKKHNIVGKKTLKLLESLFFFFFFGNVCFNYCLYDCTQNSFIFVFYGKACLM